MNDINFMNDKCHEPKLIFLKKHKQRKSYYYKLVFEKKIEKNKQKESLTTIEFLKM